MSAIHHAITEMDGGSYMKALTAERVKISDDYWSPRLELNAQHALLHQWEQLEESGCIDNFRLIAEGKAGFREGWFFADSDAYKWLDAACRAYATHPSQALKERIDDFVALIAETQTPGGYLYTYNQLHFPKMRWTNLQIEHELYCFGHLIEAAVAHFSATGSQDLLAVGKRAADLLLREFVNRGSDSTPGHQEIEIALIKLYRTTGEERYLALAEHFIEARGRSRRFAPQILRQYVSVNRRLRRVARARERYLAEHPKHVAFQLPGGNVSKKPRGIQLRFFLNSLTGKYFQQHQPVRRQTVPVGHAVRFAYLETAVAMLYQERGDETLLPALERTWDHMVRRRMYVTGGIGSLPVVEGFGRDYELDSEVAYAETCAALGCMFWNWEMSLITRQAKYADLLEWQLYNAAGVGLGAQGTTYLYNNPLTCRGGVTRKAWYQVPCCPSNLSRTWAELGKYLYTFAPGALWAHQYVGSRTQLDLGVPVQVETRSALPWKGAVQIAVWPAKPTDFTLHLRVPSWADGSRWRVNEAALQPVPAPRSAAVAEGTAAGISPYDAYFVPLTRKWSPGDVVELEFPMPIRVVRPHPKVRSERGKVALTRGPLVYCLESVGNPGIDIFETQIDATTLRAEFDRERLGGVCVLRGETRDGQPFTAIPYYAWANRGPSQMTVYLRA